MLFTRCVASCVEWLVTGRRCGTNGCGEDGFEAPNAKSSRNAIEQVRRRHPNSWIKKKHTIDVFSIKSNKRTIEHPSCFPMFLFSCSLGFFLLPP